MIEYSSPPSVVILVGRHDSIRSHFFSGEAPAAAGDATVAGVTALGDAACRPCTNVSPTFKGTRLGALVNALDLERPVGAFSNAFKTVWGIGSLGLRACWRRRFSRAGIQMRFRAFLRRGGEGK